MNSVSLKLQFEYQGRTWTLNKHPRLQQQLRAGEIDEKSAKDAPWYLRRSAAMGGTEKLSATDSEAIAQAKASLKAPGANPKGWLEYQAQKTASRGITFTDLAPDWLAAGLPDDAGRKRTENAATELKPLLTAALEWWGPRPVQTTTKATMLTYAAHCRQTTIRGTGERKADKALSVLSCLCQWAVAFEKIPANPFLNRPRIQAAEEVTHCHEHTCESDEQWHQILSWLFSNSENSVNSVSFRVVSGAWLAFCGLVGLRREEPTYLYRYARHKEPPPAPAKLPPGTIFQTRDGKLIMRVQRVKHGQNPYVVLHPAALDFLNHWEQYLDSTLSNLKSPISNPLFPHPENPERPLCADHFRIINRQLTLACEAQSSPPHLTTHGFGRAWYVRVRRSQGADDSVIACELGQITNGKLIRDTYGNGDDLRGGALFDWLPEAPGGTNSASPKLAWHQLTQTAVTSTNIIRL